MKREILDHLPPDADEIGDGEDEDKEMSESCENNQPAEESKENGHPEANGRLKGGAGSAVRVVNETATTATEGKPNESNSVQTTKAH